MRIFKLTRIKNIVLLDEHFDRQYLEENDATYENYLNSNIEVVLKISSSQAFRIFDEFDDEQLKKMKTETTLPRCIHLKTNGFIVIYYPILVMLKFCRLIL